MTRSWRILAGLGLVVAGLGGVGWRAWLYVQNELSPEIAQRVETILQRPVEVGDVERISLTSIRFGPSTIPAVTGDDAVFSGVDRDTASVAAIEVGFNLWEILVNRSLNLELTLEQPLVQIFQEADGAWISTQLKPIEAPGGLKTEQIRIRVREAQAILIPYQNRPLRLSQMNGVAQVRDIFSEPIVNLDLDGQLGDQGSWRLQGQWDGTEAAGDVQLRANNVALKDFNGLLPETVTITSGELNANILTQLPLPVAELPQSSGWVRLTNFSATAADLPQGLTQVNGDLQLQGQTLAIENFSGKLGEIAWQGQGTVNPQAGLNIQAQVNPINLKQLQKDWQLNFPVALDGRLEIPTLRVQGSLTNPQIQGELRNQGPVKVDEILLRQIQAPFRGTLEQLQITNLRIIPAVGGELRGDARVQTNGQVQADLRLNQVPAQPLAQAYGFQPEFDLGRISARFTAQGSWKDPNSLTAKVDFQAPDATYPTFGTALVNNQGILLPILTAQFVGGVVSAQGQIRDNTWQLALNTAGIPLRPFNRDWSGYLRGEVKLQGVVDQFSPETTRATVQAALVNSPLGAATANLAWDGRVVRVQQATVAGITSQGIITTSFEKGPRITGLDLQVNSSNLALGELGNLGLVQSQLRDLPVALELGGAATIGGRIRGTLDNLDFVANLQTQNLAVNAIKFAPGMSGQIRFGSQRGLDFALAGGQDQINLKLNSDWLPNSFLVQRQQAQARGERQGSSLNVSFAEFPLELFDIRLQPQPQPGLISGLAGGELAVNLDDFSFTGGLTVDRPGIANWIGNQLTANLSYRNGTAQIRQGQLTKGESIFALQGQINNILTNPGLVGQLQVNNGELSDLVDLATILGLTSPTPPIFANAAAVQPESAGEAQAPLLVQIRRLAEIQTLQAAQQASPPAPIPDLAALSGQFNAQLQITASQAQGINVGFDVEGSDWQWGQYPINRFSSRGQLLNQDILLNSLELQSQGGTITALGRLSPTNNSASLRIQNFPLTTLRSLIALPDLDLVGNLNATATLSGSPAAPEVRGQLSLDQASLNDAPINNATASFNYNQGRANFNGQANIDNPEPLIISGSIPYQWPLATTPLTDEQINVTVQVKDQGLALLNAFTDQLNWVDGQGEVNVVVRGTLKEPIVRGQIKLDAAEFTSPALAGPLTNVSGEIRFNDDRLRVMGLQGLFNQGQIQVVGVLPLATRFSATDPDRNSPLTLEVRQVQVKAADIFTGEVNGSVRFTDSLLSPDIGGLVQLSQGRLVLTDTLAGGNSQAELEDNLNGFLEPVVFNDLELELGENFQIFRAPVLNFIGRGAITLNGQIDNIQPQGQVEFTQGRLNLFTSLFRLVPDQPNLVTFIPSDGLDPTLNLTLQTTVQEVSSPGTINFGQSGEGIIGTSPTTLGSLTPVRIRAQVQGRASQLQSNFNGIVQLSSTPGRSNTEILALLGGGFNPDNQAANELALVNIASAAVFNNFQALIDDLLSSRTTFRIFPALVPPSNSRENRNNAAVLSLGAEVGYAVTDNLTLSAVQLLTVPEDPTRLNIGYQLTEQFRFSTQLGLDGESVGLIEFRTRF